MKHIADSKTMRFAAAWGGINAVLLAMFVAAQSSLYVLSEYLTPEVYFGANIVVAAIVAVLRYVTREPVTWNDEDWPNRDGYHTAGCGGNHPVEMQPPPHY